MLMSFLSLFGGLIFLVLGAEGLVRGSVSVALKSGVPPLVVGLTFVAFGTSMPELATSVQAAIAGNGPLVVGNVIGSNLFNTLMVVGTCALFARTGHPLCIERKHWVAHFMPLFGITLATCAALAFFNPLPRIVGVASLMILVAYTLFAYQQEKRHHHTLPDEIGQAKTLPTWAAAAMLVVGLLGLTLGARLFLLGAMDLAKAWGLTDGFAGLALVACGTAMPELVTSLIATKRRQADLAIGNVIGSNIFNLLGILGVANIMSPLAVPKEINPLGLGILAAATLALMVHTRIGGCRMTRTEGTLFILAYGLALFALGHVGSQ